MPYVKFGSHSTHFEVVASAFESELGIPAPAQRPPRDQWLATLVTELARVNNVVIAYRGEHYGYNVEYSEDRDRAFLEVVGARNGVTTSTYSR